MNHTVHELAAVIEASAHGTKLRQISRQPGRERYRGLCPFHQEKTPSFDVFIGRDGKPRFYCQSCQRLGDYREWVTVIEGKAWMDDTHNKPDSEVKRERRRAERLAYLRQRFLHSHPEFSGPIDLIDFSEWLDR